MEPYLAWLILGFALVIVEMTTGTFYLLVLGIAAFGAGATAWLGQDFTIQVLTTALVSGIGVYLVHGYRRANGAKQMPSMDAGMPAKFESWTDQANGRARVRYRDTSWDARVEGNADLQPGATVYVASADGSTLRVGLKPPA